MNFSTISNDKEVEARQGQSLRSTATYKTPNLCINFKAELFLQKHFPYSYLIFDGHPWEAVCHLPVVFWMGYWSLGDRLSCFLAELMSVITSTRMSLPVRSHSAKEYATIIVRFHNPQFVSLNCNCSILKEWFRQNRKETVPMCALCHVCWHTLWLYVFSAIHSGVGCL